MQLGNANMNRQATPSVAAASARPSRPGPGFTLIELLVVISIITTLAGMLLPALSRAKAKGKAIACLNNIKQLTTGWYMYEDENAGWLPPNDGQKGGATAGRWVDGDAKTDRGFQNIEKGVLFPFNKAPGIYRCPSDLVPVAGTTAQLRSRSYSMSTGMAHFDPLIIPRPVVKFSHIINPAPSKASVFLDEDPWSIDDGALGILPPNVPEKYYWSVPGSRHNNGCVLSFADGHVETWRWFDPYLPMASETLKSEYLADPTGYTGIVPTVGTDRDLKKLQETVPAR
jgi:prepilin-type N-terminal cleavage/methylation domain-containing protein/prepilin-type processing-associated H-X9-DG protein